MNPSAEMEHAVKQIISRTFEEAWHRHDARAFAENFAEDADFTNVFGMQAKGRVAIEEFHRPLFETMFKVSRVTIEETRTRPIRADVAAVDVRWTMTGARDPNGAEWPRRTGLLNMIVTCEAGDWSIAVMHNMDLPDPQIAEAQRRLQEERTQTPRGATRTSPA